MLDGRPPTTQLGVRVASVTVRCKTNADAVFSFLPKSEDPSQISWGLGKQVLRKAFREK